MNAGAFPRQSLAQIEKDLSKPLTEYHKNMASMWGLYKINGDSISFEQYLPGNGGPEVFARYGIILNDSTFEVTKSRHSYTGEVSKLHEVYHFRKFSPKPDSTNNIVK